MKFRQLFDEFFETKKERWKKDGQDYIVTQYNNDIDPYIGLMDLNDIKPKNVALLLKAMENKGNTAKARTSRQRIDQIFRYAIACGYCEHNPAAYVGDALKTHKVKGLSHLSINDFPRFLKAMRDQGGLCEIHYHAWLLIVLTAKRRCEAVFAEWSEIDLDNRVWRIPAARTKTGKDHICPLSNQAIAVIKNCEKFRKNKFLFPHRLRDDRAMNRWMVWQAIRRTNYTGKMTIHGVRKVFSTYAHESGMWTIDAIETQLSHEIPGVRGIYNKANYLDERRKLVQWWGDAVEKWLK